MLESCQLTTIKMGVLIRRERFTDRTIVFERKKFKRCLSFPLAYATENFNGRERRLGWKINRSRGGVRP